MISLLGSVAMVYMPRRRQIQLPIVPDNAWIAVSVYGKGKFPARTSLL
jgi:hypothetical protein